LVGEPPLQQRRLRVVREAELTADELIAKIRERGGRVYRKQEPPAVFVLTTDSNLVRKLRSLDGSAPVLRGTKPPEIYMPDRSYLRTRGGVREWDVHIHGIPVLGEKTIWEAAG